MSETFQSRRLLNRLQIANITVPGPGFALYATVLGVMSLLFSAVTVTARAKLWLGPQTIILGGAGLALGCLAALFALRVVQSPRRHLLDRPLLSRTGILCAIGGCTVLALLIMLGAFAAFPNSADEYGYLFQAATFLHGALWSAPPTDPLLFEQNLLVTRNNMWVSQYLPAWPAIIAAFELLRLPPWLATPACGAALLALLWMALRLECRSPALIVALLLAYGTSSFFLLNSATYFSHCLSGLIVIASVVCMIRAGSDRAWWWPVATGACFGLALLCRIDSAALVAAVALLGWIEQRFRWRTLIFGIAGAAPLVAAFAAYNWIITGYPLLPPTAWAGNIVLNATGLYGVEAVPQHFRMVIQTFWRLGELADTASLLLPMLYFVALALRIRTHTLRFYDVLPLVNFVVFLIYPDTGGFQMGPRYWFDGFLVMHLTVGSAFSQLPLIWQRFATACCLLLVPVNLARLPALVSFEARVMHERSSVFRLARVLPSDQMAIILMHDFNSTWNDRADRTAPNFGKDFIRNGTRFDRRVLYARGDAPDAIARACALYPNAALYDFHLDREHPDGWLAPRFCHGGER